MALIKSHSNYVLRKKHQEVSDGTVWERDMTTIGGINQFSADQTPIYKSSNFIIYVRNDGAKVNQFNTQKWLTSGDTDTWTLENVSAMTSQEDDANDLKIVLKKDYYDLRDFAYYGSLTELFRASVTDIITRFPGELYISPSNDNVYYTVVINESGERIESSVLLGSDSSYHEVSNPFNIDLHSQSMPDDEDSLRHFTEGGYLNYVIIQGEDSTPVTSWLSEIAIYKRKNTNSPWALSGFTTDVPSVEGIGHGLVRVACKGEQSHRIRINGSIVIEAWIGDNDQIFYLSNSGEEIHIRPKEEFLTIFYNGCDNFEKLLMDRKSTPTYTATFSVIKENEFGYYRELEDFTFPTSNGGYNIDATTYGFSNYTSRMIEVGEFYDSRFTDNVYRSMTHEAIKNFDWTYTREYTTGEEEEYVEGGERIQKALRVFAREFDEIKSYIDAIKDINKVSYDERNNIPDYFLTDVVSNEGWNVKLIYPYEGQRGEFVQVSTSSVTPYSIASNSADEYINGYFITCCETDGTELNQPCGYDGSDYYFTAANSATYYDECRRVNVNRIKPYTDERSYTYKEANNEFLRRLKINSRPIWRHKGTIDGIEMVLGLFGLKSKRWCDVLSEINGCHAYDADYEITEYQTKVDSVIEDKWDAIHQMYRWDWINSTKTIVYDNRSTSNYTTYGASTSYSTYQGLPLIYTEEENRRELYPYFDNAQQIDGDPYFQMNGGWFSQQYKNGQEEYYFQFDSDSQVVTADTRIYKETVRNIRRVDTLNDLFDLPYNELSDGTVIHVTYLYTDMLVVDGIAYTINEEYNPTGLTRYISLVKEGDFIQVGQDKFFDETITVYNSEGEVVTYDLDSKDEGYLVKAYITNDNAFICRSSEAEDSYGISTVSLFKAVENGMTNYFILTDVDFKTYLVSEENDNGWKRLKNTDSDYLKINTIINNNKGNNPHNGNMVYDNGEGYFKYFEQLFKYPIDNDLFDERCYEDYYYVRDNEIKNFGFTFSNYKEPGQKIHSYCNYYSRNVNGTLVDHKLGSNDLNQSYLSMNNKYLTISFFLKETKINDGHWEQIKYIDDIIMNYVTQMIPSSTILEVQYLRSTALRKRK